VANGSVSEHGRLGHAQQARIYVRVVRSGAISALRADHGETSTFPASNGADHERNTKISLDGQSMAKRLV
jgi:hypothetical protein